MTEATTKKVFMSQKRKKFEKKRDIKQEMIEMKNAKKSIYIGPPAKNHSSVQKKAVKGKINYEPEDLSAYT